METPPRNIKPLGHRAYGSIPHLPGSRLGLGDHHCGERRARIEIDPDLKSVSVMVAE
jgi:hypothetical protein